MFVSAKKLLTDGYLMVELAPESVSTGRTLFLKYITDIPEVKRDVTFDGDIGAGSFGALNYASSYHNEASVYIDEFVADTMEPILTTAASLQGLSKWSVLPDRLCYRTKKQPPETWHSDHTAGATSTEDLFFGTIVNLNEKQSQIFTCVPGSHTLGARLEGGEYTPVDKAKLAEYKANAVTLTIPPNHALLFFENIIHRVSGKKPKTPLLRKYVAFRLSDDATQWNPSNINRMATQSALAHKGGEVAPMYPNLWWVNWADKLEAYSERLIPAVLTQATYKSGKKRGRTITLPHKIPVDLQTLGCKYVMSDSASKRFCPRLI